MLTEGQTVAMLALWASILTLVAHIALFPWVEWRARKIRSTILGRLQDPTFGATVPFPKPPLPSDPAAAMAQRRWEVAAEKEAKVAQTKATILATLASSVGEIW